MSEVLFTVLGLKLTAWKCVGFAGTLIFTGRWLVQLLASRRTGRPTLPILFWYMSIMGSLLMLLYFIFGKNDSVGIVSNSFPLLLATYNLFLELNHRHGNKPGPGDTPLEVV